VINKNYSLITRNKALPTRWGGLLFCLHRRVM